MTSPSQSVINVRYGWHVSGREDAQRLAAAVQMLADAVIALAAEIEHPEYAELAQDAHDLARRVAAGD